MNGVILRVLSLAFFFVAGWRWAGVGFDGLTLGALILGIGCGALRIATEPQSA